MHASMGIVSVDRCPHFGQVSSLVVITMGLVGERRRARRGRQLRKQRLHLLCKDTTVQVRELRAATQGAQLMHEEARTRWFGANPFRFGAVDQPDIPGVHPLTPSRATAHGKPQQAPMTAANAPSPNAPPAVPMTRVLSSIANLLRSFDRSEDPWLAMLGYAPYYGTESRLMPRPYTIARLAAAAG